MGDSDFDKKILEYQTKIAELKSSLEELKEELERNYAKFGAIPEDFLERQLLKEQESLETTTFC